MSNVRATTNKILEAIEEGLLDKDMVILSCLNYMSEDDVRRMANMNEFFYDPEEEEEKEEEEELRDSRYDLVVGDYVLVNNKEPMHSGQTGYVVAIDAFNGIHTVNLDNGMIRQFHDEELNLHLEPKTVLYFNAAIFDVWQTIGQDVLDANHNMIDNYGAVEECMCMRRLAANEWKHAQKIVDRFSQRNRYFDLVKMLSNHIKLV